MIVITSRHCPRGPIKPTRCHFHGGGNPEKNYKYSKFLKLKARFISLDAGFPPPRE
ncbi:MAG: hypothetical protein ACEY3D_05540 [Rickettsia sp.]|uniref:hypothetical protein n=1 Tax=Rickettsia sp. TaxID=789 RepID=UPI00397B9486